MILPLIKAAEHLIGIEHLVEHCVGPAGLQDAVEDELALLGKLFAAGQQVDGHDDADDEVLEDGDHIQHADAHAADDVLHGGHQGVFDPAVQIHRDGVVGLIDVVHNDLVVGHELQIVDPADEVAQVGSGPV